MDLSLKIVSVSQMYSFAFFKYWESKERFTFSFSFKIHTDNIYILHTPPPSTYLASKTKQMIQAVTMDRINSSP